jgi:hypothetical protein
MIQLATDPNASRSNWSSATAEAKSDATASRRPHNGHAWPFISRYAERPASPKEPKREQDSQSGS